MISVGRPYSRQTAAYPVPWLLEKKFWPTVSRIDDGEFGKLVSAATFLLMKLYTAYGDLNLIVSAIKIQY